jgi:catechol 2,3-dioxygenase-like lactoylglutathione lyase family enzyme
VKPVPIVYVTDMERSLAWYRAVIPNAAVVSSSPFWTELSIDGAALALHSTESPTPGTQVGLTFATPVPLEDVAITLSGAGIEPAREISDEPFGRSMVLEDPDGLRIQVNEHDPDRYPTP